MLKRLYAVALLTLSFIALAACSTNPYSVQPRTNAIKVSGPLRLPADADRSAMDRQYELVSRGLYLLPDGSVKPLPAEAPEQPATQPLVERPAVAKSQAAIVQRPVEQRAAQQRPTRRAKTERARPTKEELVFDELPQAVDITKGATQ